MTIEAILIRAERGLLDAADAYELAKYIKAARDREVLFAKAVRDLEKSSEKIIKACFHLRDKMPGFRDLIDAHDILVDQLRTDKLPAQAEQAAKVTP